MSKKDQEHLIIAIVVAIVLLVLWLLSKKKPAGALPEQMAGTVVPVVGGDTVIYPVGGISIPSINFPPHEGPIIWPSLDPGGGTNNYGSGSCCCISNDTAQYNPYSFYGWPN